jgi:hypothetical protein
MNELSAELSGLAQLREPQLGAYEKARIGRFLNEVTQAG